MNIAIIPARGGSKRIPNKNIKNFCGKPMIAYAIDCALESKLFQRVIVSTDSEQIKEIALDFGAEVPSLRPFYVSNDEASTLDVMCYEVTNLGLHNNDVVACIYPTTPLLQTESLIQARQKLKKGHYCFSVCEYNSNPLRSFCIKEGKLHWLSEDSISCRSQDLEVFYYDAGQFYFGYAKDFASKKPILSEDSIPFVLPQKNVVDINTKQDWEMAEIRYKIICAQ